MGDASRPEPYSPGSDRNVLVTEEKHSPVYNR
jgi:hypothetical protein